MLCLRILRPRRNIRSTGRENNNERSTNDVVLEDSIGGEGEIIAEANIVTQREVEEDDAPVKSEGTAKPSEDANNTESPGLASVVRTPSDAEESERRQEEREALRTLDEALGKDAISEGGSSIMEPSSLSTASPQQRSNEKGESVKFPPQHTETQEGETKDALNTGAVSEHGSLSALNAAAKNEADKPSDKEAKEPGHAGDLLKQNSEDSAFKDSAPPSPLAATTPAAGDSILSDEFRGMRLKSDDNSSLGEISVDPRLDTGSSLDGLIPPESPVGIDALEGAGSDEDSDYPEERNPPNEGQNTGFGKVSTLLTGKHYSDAQVTPRAGDVTFRKSAPSENVKLQGSNASPLEMVISSKMATDTQEELVTALNKVRTLQAKVTKVESDVNEAQSYAIEARKEAMEAKDEAIKAKQQAAEAMAEALEAKKDASLKRQEIQKISKAGSIEQLMDNVQEQNSPLRGTGEEESLGFVPSGASESLSSIGFGSPSDIRETASPAVESVSSVSVDTAPQARATVSGTVDDGVRAAESERRAVAQQSNAIAGKLEDDIQDVRSAAASVKNGLTFSSIWSGFLVRLCLLLITIGASGHLIVAILKTIDDESYIKLGVYAFILVCIFLPTICLAIYLLVKSNVSSLYKATRELNAASKMIYPPRSTVTFSDHVVELPPLNYHDADDGLEEISLGSRTSERDTTPITDVSNNLQSHGTSNPAFENNINV